MERPRKERTERRGTIGLRPLLLGGGRGGGGGGRRGILNNNMSGFNPPPWASSPTQAAFLLDKSSKAQIEIDKRPCYVIGRDPSMADVVIDSPAVSRRHAAIVFHGENKRYYIIDLASREGTLVDGVRIATSKPTHVKHNSVIQIGPKTYNVGLVSQTPPNPTNEIEAPHHHPQQHQEVRASHILVKHRGSRNPSSWKEPVVTRSEEEAMSIIKCLRRRIVEGGEDFAHLASVESHCSSARHGGDLGWFGRGKMQPPFEQGAFSLQVGEVSEPVVSSSGVHIILRTG